MKLAQARDVCTAITSGVVLQFNYETGGARMVEPYLHGFTTSGSEVLCGFQLTGDSATGTPTGWKRFALLGISDLRVTGVRVPQVRPEYKARGKGIVRVHCCV